MRYPRNYKEQLSSLRFDNDLCCICELIVLQTVFSEAESFEKTLSSPFICIILTAVV